MSIRRDPIYISYETWRALWLLSKSHQPAVGKEAVTPDSLADGMLRHVIAKDYPQLLEHQKKLDKLEAEVIKSLTK